MLSQTTTETNFIYSTFHEPQTGNGHIYVPITGKLLRHWSNYNGGQQIIRCDFRKEILLNYIRLILERYNLFIIISTFTEALFLGVIDLQVNLPGFFTKKERNYSICFIKFSLFVCFCLDSDQFQELKLHLGTNRKLFSTPFCQYMVCLCYLFVFTTKFGLECLKLPLF